MREITDEQLESLLDSAIRTFELGPHPLFQWLCHSDYMTTFAQSALLALSWHVSVVDPLLRAKILMIQGFLAGYEMRCKEQENTELEAMFQEQS